MLLGSATGINIYVIFLRRVRKVVTLNVSVSWKIREAETETQICTYIIECDNDKRDRDKSRPHKTVSGAAGPAGIPALLPLHPGTTRSRTWKKLWWEITWQRYRIYSVLQEAHFPAAPSTNLILRETSDLISLVLQIRPAYKTDREFSNKAELEQLGKEERKGRMLMEIKGIILSQGSLQMISEAEKLWRQLC